MPYNRQDIYNAIYEITKKVYNNHLSLSHGTDILSVKYGVNKNSFENWIAPTYKCMLQGQVIRGSISIQLRKVFLDNILKDIGTEGLRLSLQSYIQTIEYYESIGRKRPGDRALYDEYSKLLNDSILNDKIENISEELDETEDIGEIEGFRKQVYVNAYERNSKARKNAIKYHGTNCYVCGMSFEETYGELGRGFIHIHHVVPLAKIGKEYEVNYKTDLIPVCPNCHAMLHRRVEGKVLTANELKDRLKK